VPSGSGLCSFNASFDGAVIHTSTSAGVLGITGIAFEWMAPTSEFGSVVRNNGDRGRPIGRHTLELC
jgi:hypothetical protein